MNKVNKEEFFDLMENEGYTADELKHLFHVICCMDRKVRRWVLGWLRGEGYPRDRIEGVTVMELVENQGLKPLNAFIVMDWLIKDPDAAKYSLTRPTLELLIDEATKTEIVRTVGVTDTDTKSDVLLSEEGDQCEEITEE